MKGAWIALAVCVAVLVGLSLWYGLDGSQPSESFSAKPGLAHDRSSMDAVVPVTSDFDSPDAESSLEVREAAAADVEARATRRRGPAPNPDAVTISGRILDPWSVPLDGARVRAVQMDGVSRGRSHLVFADVDGRFTISAGAGAIELQADHPDHLAVKLELGELHKGELRENIELRLGEARTVVGTVFWPDHIPARWVTVEAFDVPRPPDRKTLSLYAEPRRALTDEEGRFEMRGFTTDPIRLKASALADDEHAAGATNERFNAWSEDVIPGHGSVVLVLEAGARISGRVIDEFGAPWASGYILAREVGSSGKPLRIHFQGKDGAFDLRKLHAGAYEIAATGGFSGAGPSVTVEAPGIAEGLELVAPRGAKLAGTVVVGGAPIGKATVSLRFLRGPSQPLFEDYPFARNPWEMRTNAAGRFELRQIREGTHLLTASHPERGRTEFEMEFTSGDKIDDFVIELGPTGRIEGRLAVEVSPSAGRSIRILSEAQRADTEIRTDEAGRFAAENLIPGEYVVRLDAADADESVSNQAVIVVEVLPGRTTSVVLGGVKRMARIEGHVLCNGVSRAGIEVLARSFDGTQRPDHTLGSVADGDGRFVLDLPGGGNYALLFGKRGGGPRFDLFLPDGAVLRRTFELPSGTISGRVLDRAGSPARGAGVRIEGDSDSVEHTAIADDDGAFTFEHVEPGRYVLIGGGYGWGESGTVVSYGHGESPPFELSAGEHVIGMSLVLPASASLRGRVLPRHGGTIEEIYYVTAISLQSERSSFDAEIVGDSYSLTSLGPGDYRIEVVAAGGSLSRHVTVVEGEHAILDLTLE